jgi:hypothetical protein
MTRKALARRIAEPYLTSQQRREAPAPPQREGLRGFWLGVPRPRDCSSVKDHSGYSPSYCQSGSDRRAPSQNSQQRCYTSLRLDALDKEIGKSGANLIAAKAKLQASF